MISAEEYLDLNVVETTKRDSKILKYDGKIEEQLIDLSKNGYPFEICGFLLGKKEEQDSVTELFSVENQARYQERRFEINGLDYLKVESYALEHDLDVIGIYHSHPDYPAIPSKHDLEFAQEVFSYVIVSIDALGIGLINSWKLENEKFINQSIEVK